MCPIASGATTTNSALPTPVADAEVPDFVPNDPASKEGYRLAASLLAPAVLNHSIRVFVLAKRVAGESDNTFLSQPSNLTLLFIASILHDIGTTSHCDGEERFEVEGADLANGHLLSHGFSKEDAHDVWVAIAIHTSPGIAERIAPLSRYLRLAVVADFGRREVLKNQEEVTKEVEGEFPRLGIEKVLGDLVVEQAVRRPEKAPAASWPGVMYRSHLAEPDWDGVNKAF